MKLCNHTCNYRCTDNGCHDQCICDAGVGYALYVLGPYRPIYTAVEC